MRFLLGAVLLVLAAVLFLAAGFSLHNLINIVMYRRETISVVNTLIGLGVLIIALAALASLLVRKSLKLLK